MSLPLVLLGFLTCAMLIVAAGTVLARNGDVIAARTSLGGLWVGSVFLAIATSLPELTTDLSAVLLDLPDLAVGDLFGSSMANMMILAVIGMMHSAELFRRAALDNAVSAALAIILTAIAAITVLVGPSASLGGVGPGTVVIVAVYLVGSRAIYRHSATAREAGQVIEMSREAEAAVDGSTGERVTLRRAIAGFLGASLVILVVAPPFARFAGQLADATGLSASFVGVWLVGISTSLPELVTSVAAVRIGAYDLAVGNLFGSNAFNMVLLLPLDAAHRSGPILSVIHPVHAVTALIAVVLMAIGLAAIVFREGRRMSLLEPSSGLILVGYVIGIGVVYWMSSIPA